jgi:hypothetical protein
MAITIATIAASGPTRDVRTRCLARSQVRSADGSLSCPNARTASRPATLVAGVSPSIHISRMNGNTKGPCSANSQFWMLSGNKNQQTVTSTALKPTASKSSRPRTKIRAYSDLTAVETSESLTSLGTTLIFLSPDARV